MASGAAGDNRFRGALARRAQARFRAWDVAASRNVDHFVANSRHIADAIARCYDREATVIYPPVDVERFRNVGRALARSGYVTVSRLVPYKRIDVIIDAFRADARPATDDRRRRPGAHSASRETLPPT